MTVGRPRGGFGAKPLPITVECTGCRVKKMEIARLQEVIKSTRLILDELHALVADSYIQSKDAFARVPK